MEIIPVGSCSSFLLGAAFQTDLFSCDSEGLATDPSPEFPKLWLMVLMPSLFMSHPIALPALFKRDLVNVEGTENRTAVLQCELSKPAPVEWRRGKEVLRASEKYKMRLKDTTAELTIHSLEEGDAGDYTCVCGDKTTTASLTVHGKISGLRGIFCVVICDPPVGSQSALGPFCYFKMLWQLFQPLGISSTESPSFGTAKQHHRFF